MLRYVDVIESCGAHHLHGMIKRPQNIFTCNQALSFEETFMVLMASSSDMRRASSSDLNAPFSHKSGQIICC